MRSRLIRVLAVGLAMSILGLFLLIGFKHSSETLSLVGLILVLPFALVSAIQDRIPEALFWPSFVVSQIAYVWIVVRAAELVVGKFARKGDGVTGAANKEDAIR